MFPKLKVEVRERERLLQSFGFKIKDGNEFKSRS